MAPFFSALLCFRCFRYSPKRNIKNHDSPKSAQNNHIISSHFLFLRPTKIFDLDLPHPTHPWMQDASGHKKWRLRSRIARFPPPKNVFLSWSLVVFPSTNPHPPGGFFREPISSFKFSGGVEHQKKNTKPQLLHPGNFRWRNLKITFNVPPKKESPFWKTLIFRWTMFSYLPSREQ